MYMSIINVNVKLHYNCMISLDHVGHLWIPELNGLTCNFLTEIKIHLLSYKVKDNKVV